MKRNYGIDLLRMVAMLLIIILHIVGIGGICSGAELLSPQFLLAQFLRIASVCAVNCYALISGFVGWRRSPKLSGLLNLWVKVICFCVGIVVLGQLAAPDLVSLADLKKALTPAFSGVYWYFSAYVVLFFLTPVLNHAVRHISGREACMVMGGMAVLVFTLPVTKLTSVFPLGGGYGAMWLVLLYLAGGFMGRFELHMRYGAKGWTLIYLLAVLGNYLPRMLLLVLKPEFWTPENQNLMVQYTSPTIVLAAAALVGLFARLELGQPVIRVVKTCSPHAFGIYLLHTHPLIFQNIIVGKFASLGTASVPKLLIVLLAAAAIIYAAGTAADWLLSKALNLLRLPKPLKKLDKIL